MLQDSRRDSQAPDRATERALSMQPPLTHSPCFPIERWCDLPVAVAFQTEKDRLADELQAAQSKLATQSQRIQELEVCLCDCVRDCVCVFVCDYDCV